MIREIKFRQKTIDKNGNKVFHYWGFMDNGSFIRPIQSNNGTYWTALENSEQYTGLKDKNGKEIYEGDICKQYSYGHYLFKGMKVIKWSHGNKHLGWNITNGSAYEVIGNIYSNPELLKS